MYSLRLMTATLFTGKHIVYAMYRAVWTRLTRWCLGNAEHLSLKTNEHHSDKTVTDKSLLDTLWNEQKRALFFLDHLTNSFICAWTRRIYYILQCLRPFHFETIWLSASALFDKPNADYLAEISFANNMDGKTRRSWLWQVTHNQQTTLLSVHKQLR